MPYIIATKRPGIGTSEGLSIQPGGFFSQRLASVTRRAVATLEETQALLREAIIGSAHPDVAPRLSLSTTECLMYHGTISSLPKTGGTIGLPDGTVIEVEFTNWADMAKSIGKPYSKYDWRADELLDAFNARQS
jgi:hypothetical protein